MQGSALCVALQNPYQTNLLLAGWDETEGPSLYWLDYLATMHKMNIAGTGYGAHSAVLRFCCPIGLSDGAPLPPLPLLLHRTQLQAAHRQFCKPQSPSKLATSTDSCTHGSSGTSREAETDTAAFVAICRFLLRAVAVRPSVAPGHVAGRGTGAHGKGALSLLVQKPIWSFGSEIPHSVFPTAGYRTIVPCTPITGADQCPAAVCPALLLSDSTLTAICLYTLHLRPALCVPQGIEEVKARLVVAPPSYVIKVVDKDGIREVKRV